MRKAILGILVTVIVLSLCATTAFAAGTGRRYSFVDKDGDGICDNHGGTCRYADADQDGVCDVCCENHGSCLTGEGTAFVDTDGDGICDNCGVEHRCSKTGAGCGRNFVDADGNGVCDHYGTCQGRGNGQSNGAQGGCGRNFVDGNGDGVCDNRTSGQGQGGHGCSSQGRHGSGFRGGRSK